MHCRSGSCRLREDNHRWKRRYRSASWKEGRCHGLSELCTVSLHDSLRKPCISTQGQKIFKEEINSRVREVAEFLKIAHLLERKPKQLSGGEQQRVALGRAIIRKPKVFLMDEPLSNLDAKLRIYMRAELKKLQRELKTKMVYVTHDQAEAMTMADRIAVFNSGRIQQLDTPLDLYMKPENLFVAGFI